MCEGCMCGVLKPGGGGGCAMPVKRPWPSFPVVGIAVGEDQACQGDVTAILGLGAV
jgi:hypothetical protein